MRFDICHQRAVWPRGASHFWQSPQKVTKSACPCCPPFPPVFRKNGAVGNSLRSNSGPPINPNAPFFRPRFGAGKRGSEPLFDCHRQVPYRFVSINLELRSFIGADDFGWRAQGEVVERLTQSPSNSFVDEYGPIVQRLGWREANFQRTTVSVLSNPR